MAKRKIAYNKSEYPNSFKRQGAFPLDETSVKYSKADLDTYAKSNDAGAYVGQIVTVVPPDANSKTEAETYVIYSEDGSVNRLVKESELLALDATSSVDKTENNLQYIATLSQADGKITASHKTLTAGDNISIKAAKDTGTTTIANTAAYAHSSTGADTSTSNLEYITEVTQSKGQISAKKKTLSGTANNISVTTAANGTTTIKDIAEVKDDSYKDTDSQYVAQVTQTDGKIAYKKHTIVQGDNISVSTSGSKTTIGNTAAFTDNAVDNQYVSEVDQSKGAISVSRRTILENTVAETDNNASTTTSNGSVEVLTSMVKPATSGTTNKGIIPKKRKIKGAKDIEVVVGKSTSDITVQHSNTVAGSDGKVDTDGKSSTTQTADGAKITNGGTFTISDVNYNAQGHVTSENTAILTVPKYSQGTGISITLDAGKTNEYTIGHSNSVTAKTSYTDISTDDDASVNIVTPKYDAQGHVTGTANQNLTVGAASTTKLGTVRAGYTDNDANIKLRVESDGNAYSTLTDTAIETALNGDLILQPKSGTDEGGQIQLLPSTTDAFKDNTGVIIDTAHGDLRVFGYDGGDDVGNLLLIDPYAATVGGASDNAKTYTFNGSFALPASIKNKYTTKSVGGVGSNTQITDTTIEGLLKTILGISSSPSGFSFTLDTINANLNATSGTTTARWKITSHGDNTGAYNLTIGGKTATTAAPTNAGTSLSGTISGVPISFTAGAHSSNNVRGTAAYTGGSLTSSASATITNTCYYGANSTSQSNRTSVSGWTLGPITANNAKLFVKYPSSWGALTKVEHVNAAGLPQADLTSSFTPKSNETLNGGSYRVYELNVAVTGSYYLKFT